MDDKVAIKIRDQSGSIVEELQFDNISQFRLLYFDTKGHPRILGRLPLKTIKKSSKLWAEDWASGQDIAEVKDAFAKYHAGLSPEVLLESATDGTLTKQGMQRDYGKKDGAVVYAILWPMFTALMRRLRQAMMKPVTAWQFVRSPGEGIGSILGWLFRRQHGNNS